MKKIIGLALLGATVALTAGCNDNKGDNTPLVKEGYGLNYTFDFNKVKESKFNYVIDGSKETNIEGTVKYFKTVQSFLDYSSTTQEELKVFIKDGVYKEKLVITTPNITMVGESAAGTILTYDDASDTPKPGGGTVGTSGSASVDIKEAASGFTAMNLTFENAFDEATSSFTNKQAVALKNNADMSLFYNVRFIGNQDTLYPDKGRQYFYECYIEGDVDFIFGGANIIIDKSVIHSVDRATNPRGYITAARTNHDIEDAAMKSPYGFVFMNNKFTSNIDHTKVAEQSLVYLGRPWRQEARVAYLNSDFGAHISAYRWTDMSGNTAKNAYFREYNTTGEGAKLDNNGSIFLSKAEYEPYTIENIFSSIPRFSTKFAVYDKIDGVVKSIK